MGRIRYTLVTDGTSDSLLRHPIEWLLETLTSLDFDGVWANPQAYPERKEKDPLFRDLKDALINYPCDLLFVHRDAERVPWMTRITEIKDTVGRLSSPPPAVCVVPVRMTEAWMLINEQALREAAGNPNGRVHLGLPPIRTLESLPAPKRILFDLLRKASERSRRRLKKFSADEPRHRLAELIEDYTPLKALPAFQAFQQELEQVLAQHGWDGEQHDAHP